MRDGKTCAGEQGALTGLLTGNRGKKPKLGISLLSVLNPGCGRSIGVGACGVGHPGSSGQHMTACGTGYRGGRVAWVTAGVSQ